MNTKFTWGQIFILLKSFDNLPQRWHQCNRLPFGLVHSLNIEDFLCHLFNLSRRIDSSNNNSGNLLISSSRSSSALFEFIVSDRIAQRHDQSLGSTDRETLFIGAVVVACESLASRLIMGSHKSFQPLSLSLSLRLWKVRKLSQRSSHLIFMLMQANR